MSLPNPQINMLKQQIRVWNVQDEKVLNVLARVPREIFVPELFRTLAYADTPIPLAHDQAIAPPNEIARALQALRLQCDEVVLQIGTGTGYLTALLAGLAKQVVSIDIHADFTEQAKQNLASLAITNVTLKTGDALQDAAQAAMYSVVVLTGSLSAAPKLLLERLVVGGRLFAVIGEAPAMQAVVFERLSADKWRTEVLFETKWPRLSNINQTQAFVF